MSFLDHIFDRLQKAAARPVLQEIRGEQIVSATGEEILKLVGRARHFLRQAGVRKGDRCVLVAPNSIRWAAADLAMMAEGAVAVPLYHRQAAAELAEMIRDSKPTLLVFENTALREAILPGLPEARSCLLEEMFSGAEEAAGAVAPLAEGDVATIIYTSGTSGEPKGVMLGAGNVNHMLRCTTSRLDTLMHGSARPERVFHYLPFCFAGSWILLLTCLSRESVLTLSTDVSRVADEMRLAAPHYLLNVPLMLERMRAKIEESLQSRGRLAAGAFANAWRAFTAASRNGTANANGAAPRASLFDAVSRGICRAIIFPAIRKKLGPNLKALICGSAPLSRETQLFFMMLGIPVLQVYGLTETTAICTMDVPGKVEPGLVGPAIAGTEMKLAEDGEILVRGPHIFLGYWNRPQATRDVMRDGWFHTGDQGQVSARGNWRITGRVKNLIVPASGHNVAPEPIEQALQQALPAAQQVMLVGSGRSHLAALITGPVPEVEAEAALERVNSTLPHYKRIHAFLVLPEPFTIEAGLLTVNGKLKRDAILARYAAQIESMYQQQPA